MKPPFIPSDENLVFFDAALNTTDNLALCAVAGSGKTECLVQLTKRIPRPTRIIALMFGRDLALAAAETLEANDMRLLTGIARTQARPRGARSLSSHLQSRLGLKGVKAGLLRECLSKAAFEDSQALAAGIKRLPQVQGHEQVQVGRDMVTLLQAAENFACQVRRRLLSGEHVSSSLLDGLSIRSVRELTATETEMVAFSRNGTTLSVPKVFAGRAIRALMASDPHAPELPRDWATRVATSLCAGRPLREVFTTESVFGIRAIARLGGPDVAAMIWDAIAAKRA